jgi:broad specificity phosphatase PhoE
LIRHGQTDYNLKGIVQGSKVNADLNDTGRAQAASFYAKYKDVPFDKIYISKLKRTAQSVKGFIELGIPLESYEGLNEISWGDQDGVISNADSKGYFELVSNEWKSGNFDFQIGGGGESPNQVAKRQRAVMDIIFSKERENEKTILICMHGRAMRILLCQLMKISLASMDEFEHTNLCLYLLGYDEEKITILKRNHIEHITEALS